MWAESARNGITYEADPPRSGLNFMGLQHNDPAQAIYKALIWVAAVTGASSVSVGAWTLTELYRINALLHVVDARTVNEPTVTAALDLKIDKLRAELAVLRQEVTRNSVQIELDKKGK